MPGRLAGLSGWRRLLTAFLLGVLLAAAMPPVHLLVAALVALTGFVWLLDGAASVRRAWFDSWAFGAGFSAAGLYWIANALLVNAARYGWMVPFALVLIALGFGLFAALAAALAVRAPRGSCRILSFALAWLVLEWVRSWLFTGFPWNPLGSAFAFADALLQPAAWGGPWLLSALLLVAALAPAMAVAGPPERRARALAWGLALSVGLVALQYGVGSWRLARHPTEATEIVVRVVQPAIPQALKWQPELMESHFATHIALSLSQSAVAPDVIVWPEAAIPWAILREPGRRAEAGSTLRDGALLLTGAVRFERDAAGNPLPYNSLVALDRNGDLRAAYDKQHLVPFGEYVPLKDLLPIDKLTPGLVDFVPGTGSGVVAAGKIPPFRALVCYEVIFPAEIATPGVRPAWLLNVTNDGWYGVSTGPFQHLEASRLRAIEQGLPLVRAAGTGISAVIDPVGRVLHRLPLDTTGVIDAALPAPLPEAPLYARWGDWTLLGVLLPGLLVLAWRLRCLRRAGDG